MEENKMEKKRNSAFVEKKKEMEIDGERKRDARASTSTSTRAQAHSRVVSQREARASVLERGGTQRSLVYNTQITRV